MFHRTAFAHRTGLALVYTRLDDGFDIRTVPTLVLRSRQLLQPLRDRTISVFLGLERTGLYMMQMRNCG